jgi:hypothetical protein
MPLATRIVSILTGLVAVIWLLPAVVVGMASPDVTLDRYDREISLSLDGIWPAWPFGFSVARLDARSGGQAVALTDARTTFWPDGLHLEGNLEGGTLLLRSSLDGSEGFARVEDLPLERLALALPIGLEIHGQADGVLHWGENISLEAWVMRGGVQAGEGLAALSFSQLAIDATRGAGELWEVALLQMQGPPLSFAGGGQVGSGGELALSLEVELLDEPARSYLRVLGVREQTPPFVLEVTGRLRRPRFRTVEQP